MTKPLFEEVCSALVLFGYAPKNQVVTGPARSRLTFGLLRPAGTTFYYSIDANSEVSKAWLFGGANTRLSTIVEAIEISYIELRSQEQFLS